MEGTADDTVRRARHGDEGAFVALYRELTPALLRYARVMVGEDSAVGAEDVVSESWAQIARALPEFDGGAEEFRRFTVVVVRNRALDVLRRRRRVRQGEIPVPDEELRELAAAGPGDPVEGALEALSTERAVALIAGLPREQAEAVMLRVVLGLDAASAGRLLGKRPGAVRMAVSRGLRTLGEQVGQATTCAGNPVRGARKR